MKNFAYLRVSTDKQDAENQKLSVLNYCNTHHINNVQFIEDIVSGKTPWRERAIGKLLETAKKGDCIISAEISRLGRSALQVLEILEVAAQKGVSVHIAKNNIRLDGSMQSTITATIFGLAAQIEREFISARTKEALEKCRQNGIKLGRPKGKLDTIRLDSHHIQIEEYLQKGISKLSIAKLLDCAPSTLYSWFHRRKVNFNKKEVAKK